MKRILAAVAAAMFVVSLSGCSAQAPAPVVTVTQQAPAPAPAPVSGDAAYLAALHSTNPVFYSIPDTTLLSAGYEVCAMLNQGVPFTSVASSLIAKANGQPEVAKAFGNIMGAAVVNLCPSHTAAMNDYVANNTSMA